MWLTSILYVSNFVKTYFLDNSDHHTHQTVPPINVEIVLSSKEAFHKGQNAQILCRSHGSRPVAQLHWYRHGQRVLSRIE